jgi:AraC-like DNA-binding protein
MNKQGLEADFPAISFSPGQAFEAIHRFYLLLEPDLLASIQRGDTRESRRLINHVLVHIYSLGEERSEFLKFLLLEFVVMLARRAIEAGGESREILRVGFAAARELTTVMDDEDLAHWLRRTLDGLMVLFPRKAALPQAVERALDYMRAHAGQVLRREAVAKACGVSDAHLNELLKQSVGRSYREVLRNLRVEKAAELLAHPRAELAEIALACGFCDQSHLSRVFREVRGVTPKEFRQRMGGVH